MDDVTSLTYLITFGDTYLGQEAEVLCQQQRRAGWGVELSQIARTRAGQIDEMPPLPLQNDVAHTKSKEPPP